MNNNYGSETYDMPGLGNMMFQELDDDQMRMEMHQFSNKPPLSEYGNYGTQLNNPIMHLEYMHTYYKCMSQYYDFLEKKKRYDEKKEK